MDGPISVLEIGCGDVPLGCGLANDLKSMEATTGADSQLICNRIVCTDYSPTVIEVMRRCLRGNVYTIWREAGTTNFDYLD